MIWPLARTDSDGRFWSLPPDPAKKYASFPRVFFRPTRRVNFHGGTRRYGSRFRRGNLHSGRPFSRLQRKGKRGDGGIFSDVPSESAERCSHENWIVCAKNTQRKLPAGAPGSFLAAPRVARNTLYSRPLRAEAEIGIC